MSNQESKGFTNHVLTACHKPLVDNFGGIVSTGINMNTFLHHRVGASSQRLTDLVSTRLDLRLRCLLFAVHLSSTGVFAEMEEGGRTSLRKVCLARRRQGRCNRGTI